MTLLPPPPPKQFSSSAVVSRLLPGMPAQDSGQILLSDELVKVGEIVIKGWDISDIVNLIKGRHRAAGGG